MNLLNSKDPLMVKLNDIKKDYEVLPVNAIIDNDTIVPGKKGLEVDIDKSYEEMKLGGIFREESLIYKDILPSSSISNNKDKYIVKGNSNNEVSLIVIYNSLTKQNITNISNITIYLNHKDITNTNIKKLKKLLTFCMQQIEGDYMKIKSLIAAIYEKNPQKIVANKLLLTQ
jgi:hypothetical protein